MKIPVEKSGICGKLQDTINPQLFTKEMEMKVLVAYSGGLDTSVIVKWVKETYNCEVVA